MKKILMVMLCMCLFLTACGRGKISDGSVSFDGYKGDEAAVMTINGESVSVDEFNYFLIMSAYDIKTANNVEDAELDAFWSKTDRSGKTFSELAIEDAINDCKMFHVYRTKALEKGLTLSDEEKKTVDEQANAMRNEYGDEMQRLQLKAGGLTSEVHYEITEMGYYSNKLFSNFISEFRYMTPEELESHYNKNFVRAKHILIMTIDPETGNPHTEEFQQAALDKISDILSRIENGADFDSLMFEYSEDTGLSEMPDGYTFARDDDYDEMFKEVAFSLKEGEVSGISQSEYGYHIIKREPLDKEYIETNVEHIQQNLQSGEFQQQLEKWNEEAVVVGNKPVFDKIDVGAVLAEYLAQYDETLELIRLEFMKANGDLE